MTRSCSICTYSVYGHTAKATGLLATVLSDLHVKVSEYDITGGDYSGFIRIPKALFHSLTKKEIDVDVDPQAFADARHIVLAGPIWADSALHVQAFIRKYHEKLRNKDVHILLSCSDAKERGASTFAAIDADLEKWGLPASKCKVAAVNKGQPSIDESVRAFAGYLVDAMT